MPKAERVPCSLISISRKTLVRRLGLLFSLFALPIGTLSCGSKPATFSSGSEYASLGSGASLGDKETYREFDEAYVVLITSFYQYGHVHFTFALANVTPYKTTVHFTGSVLRSLKGNRHRGDVLSFVEDFDIEGHDPCPRDHPVRKFATNAEWMAPTPAVVALKRSGKATTVVVAPIDSLDEKIRVECYQEAFSAFLASERKKADTVKLKITQDPEVPIPSRQVTVAEAKTLAAKSMGAGNEVSVTIGDNAWFCSVQVEDDNAYRSYVDLLESAGSQDGTARYKSKIVYIEGMSPKERLEWVRRSLDSYGSAGGDQQVIWHERITADSLAQARAYIESAVLNGRVPEFSSGWYLGTTWLFISQKMGQKGTFNFSDAFFLAGCGKAAWGRDSSE